MVSKNECQICGFGDKANLWMSKCEHMTLCHPCGRAMAKKKETCPECGDMVVNLIRVYAASLIIPSQESKNYFISKFKENEHPDFQNEKWSLQKSEDHDDGLILKNATGNIRYEGRREVPDESKTKNFLLFPDHEKKTIKMVPAESFCDFKRSPIVPEADQPNLQQAERLMRKRKQTVERCAKRMNLKEVGDTKSSGSSEGDGSSSKGDDDNRRFSDDDVDMDEYRHVPPVSPPSPPGDDQDDDMRDADGEPEEKTKA